MEHPQAVGRRGNRARDAMEAALRQTAGAFTAFASSMQMPVPETQAGPTMMAHASCAAHEQGASNSNAAPPVLPAVADGGQGAAAVPSSIDSLVTGSRQQAATGGTVHRGGDGNSAGTSGVVNSARLAPTSGAEQQSVQLPRISILTRRTSLVDGGPSGGPTFIGRRKPPKPALQRGSQ
jgi:hypothetical protein